MHLQIESTTMHTKPSILVVDDIQSNLDILVDLLQMYSVTVALDGTTALEMTKQHSFDLILLDIMMPVMDGYEVCKYLKSHPSTKNIPVIFITAKTDEESIEKAFSMGGVDYVTKPFKARELLSRIETHITLKLMVSDLESLVQDEVSKRQEQEMLVHRQSKMAAMGEMMDAVAHQWKQPLGVIALQTDVLLMETLPISTETLEAYHAQVMMQVKHMDDTLHEFRTFLHPSNTMQYFNVHSMIQTVNVLMKDTLAQGGIDLRFHTNTKSDLYGNTSQLVHVFINLIINAKEAFEVNGIANPYIEIKHRQVDNIDLFKIRDNAGGINENMIVDIFKANVSTKTSISEGRGIGLYLTQQIILNHSGTIGVENVEEGSSFTIILPHRQKEF